MQQPMSSPSPAHLGPDESGVEYAPTLGDELPDTDDLLGEPSDAEPTEAEPSTEEPVTEAGDTNVEFAPRVDDELPEVDALLGED
jgi:hypothetical protein